MAHQRLPKRVDTVVKVTEFKEAQLVAVALRGIILRAVSLADDVLGVFYVNASPIYLHNYFKQWNLLNSEAGGIYLFVLYIFFEGCEE